MKQRTWYAEQPTNVSGSGAGARRVMDATCTSIANPAVVVLAHADKPMFGRPSGLGGCGTG
jgi:hypothetical protein